MNQIGPLALFVLLIVEIAGTAASGLTSVSAGSVQRGETLVTTGGGGRTVRCALCHGDDLRGLVGPPPSPADRRAIWFASCPICRRECAAASDRISWSATVARLTEHDMIAIAAYVASRRPSGH